MKRSILTWQLKYLVALMVFIIACLSLSSQEAGTKTGRRYAAPDSIDPLVINIDDFYTDDLDTYAARAELDYLWGNYLEAAKNYLYIVNRNADDCEALYKIACCYANLDLPGPATDFLIMAINAGYNNFKNINQEDAFNRIRENKGVSARFNEIVSYGKNTGELTYFEVTSLEKCRIFFPDNYDPEKEYPLVIGLHGNGGSALSFAGLWNHLAGQEIIFAVPESPYNYSNNGGSLTQQYTWSIVSNDLELEKMADPLVAKYIANIAENLKLQYKISNTYLFGFSQGAIFSYYTGIKYNTLFDGLICFGGLIPSTEKYPWFLSEKELQENNNIKVFIAHGSGDSAISSSEGRAAFRYLKKSGFRVKLRIFEGGHETPPQIIIEAITWLENQN